ncbi:caspase family protein [Pedobacter aquatilis]|uniref:caspase family protein n=1 Tax=Pedobacter aquatilis TaxID=351343 RepID=UPI00292D36C8|nr:caspase family protein [Pedobacter aquatilis]
MKGLTVFLILLCSSIVSYAQQAEVIIPKGHNSRINTIAYSPDGRIIATGAGELLEHGQIKAASVKLWDAETLVEISEISGFSSPVISMAFSVDGKFLAAGGIDGRIIIWNLEAGSEQLVLNSGEGLSSIYFTAASTNIITIGKSVSSWEITQGKKLGYFPKDFTVTSSAYSPTSNVLVLSDGLGRIHVFQDDKFVKKITVFNKGCEKLDFSGPNRLLCLGSNVDLSGKASLVIKSVDLASNQCLTLYEKNFLPHSSSSLSARSLRVASLEKQRIHVSSFGKTKTSKIIEEPSAVLTTVAFSPDGGKLLASFQDSKGKSGVLWIEPESGTLIDKIAGNGNYIDQISFSKGDSTINIHHQYGSANWNIRNGVIDLFADKQQAILENRGGHKKLEALIASGEVAVSSSDEKFVLSNGGDQSREIKLLRSSDLKPLKSFMQLSAVRDLAFLKNTTSFISAGDDKTARIWDINKGTVSKTFRGHTEPINLLKICEDESLLATASLDQKIKIWNMSTGALITTLSGHTQKITAINFSSDNKLLISSSDDFSLRMWDLASGKELAEFFCVDSTDYMVSTPEGYYMSTPDAAKKLKFRLGNDLYAFSQFDLQFNRPDKVLELMGTAPVKTIEVYRRIYQKRLKKLGFDPIRFEADRSSNVPQVKIANKSLLPTTSSLRLLKFSVEANDEMFNLQKLNVYINGVPIYGSMGLPLEKRQEKKAKIDVAVKLATGSNLIEVTVLNSKGIESLRDQFSLTYNGAAELPNLYVITLGVSDYLDKRKKLDYAAKDAQDIQNLFSKGIITYSKIIKISLLNEMVTRENILNLRKTLLNTSEDDKIVLFYAGHGIPDDQLDYYLSTFDMNFSNPSQKGLLYADLEGLLDNIPSRNKLLMIDACHSGEIDKEDIAIGNAKKQTNEDLNFRGGSNLTLFEKQKGLENTFEMMKQMFVDLRVSTGATVISSAGATDEALEANTWNNGAFTYSVLQGLGGMHADANRDGKISLSELQKYVILKVPVLTNDIQKPVSRMENLLNDMRIW